MFVTGATVVELCGDAGSTPDRTCQALVMGLYNGFLYGATYGGFVTCVPDHIGAGQIVPLITGYVHVRGGAEWDHAGDLVGDLLRDLGWGGDDGEACLDPPVSNTNAGGEGDATEGAAGDLTSNLVAGADTVEGERVFAMCGACHAVAAGAPNLDGPTLWQIVGRPVASLDGYAYSDALGAYADAAGVWGLDALDAYLENPQTAVPGTSMMFRGVRDPADRANLLAYLTSLTAD